MSPSKEICEKVWFASRINYEEEISCPTEVIVPEPDQEKAIREVVNEVKEMADEYNSTHIVGLAVWAANESLARLPRPSAIHVNPRKREWLFAAFYVVLRELVTDIKFEEYKKMLERRGIDSALISVLKDKIWLRNIEMLERRLCGLRLLKAIEMYYGNRRAK